MSKTVTTYTITGNKKGTITLPDAIFDQAVNPALLAQAIRVYSSNQRQGTKKVKTRADVRYSTRKLWRQKGTGRARHGSRKAPIFVGGGVAHGPTGQENYRLRLSKSMRRQALYGALTQKNQDQTLKVLESTTNFPQKTQAAKDLVTKLFPTPNSKVLFILDQPDPQVLKAVNNLPRVTPTQASRLNVYEVVNHSHVLMTKASLEILARSTPTATDQSPTPSPKTGQK